MVSIKKDDIIQRLKYHKILDEIGNILDEEKFKEIINAVFLGLVSLERIKSFWKREVLEESVFQDKVDKVRPYYHRPFHYVGLGDKTLFISEKEVHERIFFHEFIPNFINRIEEIDLIRRSCNLCNKISNEIIKSHHGCTATENSFCDGCKNKFVEELLNNIKEFLLPLQVKSYTILNIPIEMVMAFINGDDLIEELQDNTCSNCRRFVFDYFTYCPDCGKEIKKYGSDVINREKVFNELIALYLEKKSQVKCNANNYLNESFIEIDVIASNNNKNLAIEGTSKVNLDKGYLNKKLTTLLFLDVLNYQDKNKLVLWSLDSMGDCEENLNFVKKFAKESFEILKPKMDRKIMNNKAISINNDDLKLLIEEIDYVLKELLNRVNELKN